MMCVCVCVWRVREGGRNEGTGNRRVCVCGGGVWGNAEK